MTADGGTFGDSWTGAVGSSEDGSISDKCVGREDHLYDRVLGFSMFLKTGGIDD